MDRSVITSLTGTYAFPTGRRVYTAQEVQKRAAKRALKKIARYAASLAAHDRKTLDMEIRRRAGVGGSYGPDALELDAQEDRALSGLDMSLEAQVRLYTEASERGSAAARIRRAVFPEGVAAITRLSFVQQCVAVDALLDRMAAPDLAEEMATLPELGPIVEHVRALNEQYRESIDDYERGVPTTEEVRAAQSQGQQMLAELLVLILGHYISEAPDDDEGRGDMLEPILRQNEAIRVARQRRRVPGDVNPDTGDEVDLPGADDGAPADEAPAQATPAA